MVLTQKQEGYPVWVMDELRPKLRSLSISRLFTNEEREERETDRRSGAAAAASTLTYHELWVVTKTMILKITAAEASSEGRLASLLEIG